MFLSTKPVMDSHKPKVGKFDPEAFEEFAIEFEGESERAAVVLGVAKIDYLLTEIIKKFLRPSPPKKKKENSTSLNYRVQNLQAKINFCFAVGLISEEFAQALHSLREIRNPFAHEVSGGELRSKRYKQSLENLAEPFREVKEFEKFKLAFFETKSDIVADFYAALGIMVIRLETLLHNLTPIDDFQEMELVPEDFLNKET